MDNRFGDRFDGLVAVVELVLPVVRDLLQERETRDAVWRRPSSCFL